MSYFIKFIGKVKMYGLERNSSGCELRRPYKIKSGESMCMFNHASEESIKKACSDVGATKQETLLILAEFI